MDNKEYFKLDDESQKIASHEIVEKNENDSPETAEEVSGNIEKSFKDFLENNKEIEKKFSEDPAVQKEIIRASEKSQVLIQETIDNFLNLSNINKKMKKVLYLSLISISTLLLKPNQSEAQNTGKPENQNLAKSEDTRFPSPNYYSLSKKTDLSNIKRERQLNPELLLQHNITLVRDEINRLNNLIYLDISKKPAEIIETNDEERGKILKLINEYEKFLTNPSLDTKKVGELTFEDYNFEENKHFFSQNDEKIIKLAEHIKSPEYLHKLMTEFDISEIEAKQHQAVRLDNLLRGTYSLVSDKNDNPAFVSNDKTFSTEVDTNKYTTEHEILGHKIIDAGKGIPQKTKNLLNLSYQDINENNAIFKDFSENNSIESLNFYFSSAEERYARKKALDIEMEDLGIKKYGEKFTNETLNKLMEFYNAGRLSKEAGRFIETTKPEFFEKIFNEISDNYDDQDQDINSFKA